MGKILKIAVPVLFLFFLLVWERTHLVKLNLRAKKLRRKRDDLLTQVYSLEVSAESLESYSRIEKFAKAGLDMRYPDSKNVTYIKKDGEK